MQLQISFTMLLGSLVVALLTVGSEARPMRRNAGMVTLPLKRIQQRTDLHPQILLQQQINRSHKRLARMTGRQEPGHEELTARMHKRVALLEEGSTPSKRFNRKKIGSRFNRVSSNQKPSVGQTFKAGKGKGTGTTAANSTDTATAAAATGSGFSQIDADALANGGVAVANTPTTADSVALDIESRDVGYLSPITMGTPPREFLILMDSGSADLWVGSEACTSSAGGGCGNHTFLGSKSSSSFVASNNPFQVTYGTGAVAGAIISDDISFGGLTLAAHTFGVATQETPDFADNSVPFDGLMGLAQSGLSNQKTATPPEALAAAGLIKEAITGFKISRLSDQKNDGEVTFGGLDTTKFDTATLVTVPNVSKIGFWEADMAAVTVDGTDSGLTGRTAILDTGTTLIIAPPADAAAVHKLIPGAASDGQGGFTLPCTSTAVISMSFGGTQFDINPADVAFAPVDAANPTGDCVSGISSGTIGAATEWLVGDVFLKNAYFGVDVGKNTVSLAKLI